MRQLQAQILIQNFCWINMNYASISNPAAPPPPTLVTVGGDGVSMFALFLMRWLIVIALLTLDRNVYWSRWGWLAHTRRAPQPSNTCKYFQLLFFFTPHMFWANDESDKAPASPSTQEARLYSFFALSFPVVLMSWFKWSIDQFRRGEWKERERLWGKESKTRGIGVDRIQKGRANGWDTF